MNNAVKDVRRSQRVIFKMPVNVYIYRENEEPTFEVAITLTVNAHGALLALTTPVALGGMLRLVNPRTHNEIECRVCRFAMRYPSGMTQVGVEFTAASPTFWDVPSSPPNWDPAWVAPADRMRLGKAACASEESEPVTELTGTDEDSMRSGDSAIATDSATPSDSKRNSRRSARLPFEIPVLLYAHTENKGPLYVEGRTISVSNHGAFLAVREALEIGQSLLLTISKTGAEIVCIVRSVSTSADGTHCVGVEFAASSPEFWGVTFPSGDLDAAKHQNPQRLPPINPAAPEPSVESTVGELEILEPATQPPDFVELDTGFDAPLEIVEGAIASDSKSNSQSPDFVDLDTGLDAPLEIVESAIASDSKSNSQLPDFVDLDTGFDAPLEIVESAIASDSKSNSQSPDFVDLDTGLHAPPVIAESPTPSETKPNFRRSTRLPFQIPVVVQVQEGNQNAVSFRGESIQINVNGALLAIPMAPSIGQSFLLINSKTGKEIACVVRSLQVNEFAMNHVGVEFETASPRFWGVNFPPEDWDAAERKLPQRPLPMKSAPLNPLSEGLKGRPSTTTQRNVSKAHQEQQESFKGRNVKTKSSGRRIVSWPIIALAACVVMIIIWAVVHQSNAGGSAARRDSVPSSIAPEDANVIPGLEGFRLATAEDFDPEAVSWLRGAGQEVNGEIPGEFTANGQSKAYVLVGKDAMRRIVILADGKLRCDAKYRSVAIIARVPEKAIQNITWADPPPAGTEGDGILVVRAANDLGTSVVLLLSGDAVVSGTPSNYQQIPFSPLR